MRQKKISTVPGDPKTYRAHHMCYGEEREFDSWLKLCEKTAELAQEQVNREMKPLFMQKLDELFDEMLSSVEELPPK